MKSYHSHLIDVGTKVQRGYIAHGELPNNVKMKVQTV